MRLKTIQVFLLTFISVILISVVLRSGSEFLQQDQAMLSQDGVTSVAFIGEEVIANYRIFNPSERPTTYHYEVYTNARKRSGGQAIVPSNRSFVFGGHFRFYEPGLIHINALIYDENEKLIKNSSDIVIIKERAL